MTAPTLIVECAFGSTWQTEPASRTWTDITAYALVKSGATMMRGASAARGQIDPGSLNISLKNNDRRFDPTYTAGPYYGSLKPGVPIRVQAYTAGAEQLYWGSEPLYWGGEALLWGSVSPIWYGTVAKWPQRYDRGNRFGWVPLECWDGFDKLSRAKIPRSVLDAEILADSPLAYWKLDETTGSELVDWSGNGYHGDYDIGTTGLSADVEIGGGGYSRGIVFDDGEHAGFVRSPACIPDALPIIVEFIAKPTDSAALSEGHAFRGGDGNASKVLNVKYFASIAGEKPYRWKLSINYGFLDGVALGAAITDSDPHHIGLRRTASTRTAHVDGVTVSAGSFGDSLASSVSGAYFGTAKRASGAYEFAYPGFLSSFAIFDADIGTTRINAHGQAAVAPLDDQTTDARLTWVANEIGWPTNLRSLETGNTTLGPATFKPGDIALDYFRLIERSEDGRLFITTSKNDDESNPVAGALFVADVGVAGVPIGAFAG